MNAGYLTCEEPLVSYLVIVAIDRVSLAGVNEVRLAAAMSDVSITRGEALTVDAALWVCSSDLAPLGVVVLGRE